MDKQAIFDKVSKHLLTQNAKSVDPDANTDDGIPKCLYRSPEGLKCAVGCLIKDEDYDPSINNRPVSMILARLKRSLGLRTITHKEVDFLDDLRLIHDVREPCNWSYSLQIIAIKHDLTFSA